MRVRVCPVPRSRLSYPISYGMSEGPSGLEQKQKSFVIFHWVLSLIHSKEPQDVNRKYFSKACILTQNIDWSPHWDVLVPFANMRNALPLWWGILTSSYVHPVSMNILDLFCLCLCWRWGSWKKSELWELGRGHCFARRRSPIQWASVVEKDMKWLTGRTLDASELLLATRDNCELYGQWSGCLISSVAQEINTMELCFTDYWSGAAAQTPTTPELEPTQWIWLTVESKQRNDSISSSSLYFVCGTQGQRTWSWPLALI